MKLRRTCYDRPWRCPGWAGGGWRHPRPGRDVCHGGSFARELAAEGLWFAWRWHRCPECGTVALPSVARWLDPTWLWFVLRRRLSG